MVVISFGLFVESNCWCIYGGVVESPCLDTYMLLMCRLRTGISGFPSARRTLALDQFPFDPVKCSISDIFNRVIEYVWQNGDESQTSYGWTPGPEPYILGIIKSFLCLGDGGVNCECRKGPVERVFESDQSLAGGRIDRHGCNGLESGALNGSEA